MTPDILVVTPTLGSRPEIERAIQSVKEILGPRAFHCIVGPLSKTSSLKSRFPRIHLLDDPYPKGIYSALNLALACYAYKFTYFAYINDDDFWLAGFNALVRKLDANPQTSLVYGRTLAIDRNATYIKTFGHFPDPSFFVPLISLLVPVFTQQSVLCRTSDLVDLGSFDTRYQLFGDSDLYARWILSGRRVASVTDICAAYCMEGNRLSCSQDNIISDSVLLRRYYPSNSYPRVFLYGRLACFYCYNIPNYLIRFALRLVWPFFMRLSLYCIRRWPIGRP